MTGHSVLLVDDNKSLIELFKCYATNSKKIVLSCAASLEEAIDQISEKSPDVILLDSRLTPYNDFSESVPVLRRSGYDGKIVVISCDIHDQVFSDYRNYSVDGCIDKFHVNFSNFDRVVGNFIA